MPETRAELNGANGHDTSRRKSFVSHGGPYDTGPTSSHASPSKRALKGTPLPAASDR